MPETRQRAERAPYSPEFDAPPPSPVDRVAQRVIAYAAAGGILLALILWIARVATFDARLTNIETIVSEMRRSQDAILSTTCILTRRQDPTIEPSACHPNRP
jgi:hypothetical protein